MAFDKTDLNLIKYDPNKIQSRIFQEINEAISDDGYVGDPTSPFALAIETNAMLTANSLIEMQTELVKLYPELAANDADLNRHMLFEDENMFAIPAETEMYILVNLMDVGNNGSVYNNYTKITIPEYTEIMVDDVTFSITTNLNVYKNNETIYAELINKEDNNITSIGNIDVSVIEDSSGIKWGKILVPVKQVKRTIVEDTINASKSYSNEIELNDSYYTSTHTFTETGDTARHTFNDIYFHPNVPTFKLYHVDDLLTVSLPDIYVITGGVRGRVKHTVYSTKGYITMNLASFPKSDYSITLGDTSVDIYTAAVRNVKLIAYGVKTIDGGSDGISFEDKKNKIIHNSVNRRKLPITEFNLVSDAKDAGYTINKVKDTLFNREYCAVKDINHSMITSMYGGANIITDEVKIELGVNSDYVVNDGIRWSLKSGSMIISDNGITRVMTDPEIEALRIKTISELQTYLSTNRVYVNPFYLSSNLFLDTMEIEVLDLDNPSIESFYVSSKNTNITPSVSISSMYIYTTDIGYEIVAYLNGNAEFESLMKNKLRANIEFALGEDYLYFEGTYDLDNEYYVFSMETDFYTEDGEMLFNNGISELNKTFLPLSSKCRLNIYTEEMMSSVSYNYSPLAKNPNLKDKVALTEEEVSLVFGEVLELLPNSCIPSYENNKYLTYENNVPMTYHKDVIDVEVSCTSGIGGDAEIIYTHKKGDVVYDANNEVIYKHKKGDVIYENNTPVIDLVGGVSRLTNMILIPYENYIDINRERKDFSYDHFIYCVDLIKTYAGGNLSRIKRKMLDNTQISYHTSYGIKDLYITVGRETQLNKAYCSPSIVLYTVDDRLDSQDMNNIKKTIGDIINNTLTDEIVKVSNIRDSIKNAYPNIVEGVRITNLTERENDVFKYNGHNRLYIRNVLDSTGQAIYDMDIILENIND